MHNKYTIEVFEEEGQIKAKLYIGKESIGMIWCPKSKLKNKPDFKELFESIAGVIYGKENRAEKEIQSYSEILKVIRTENSAGQTEQGC